MPGLRLANPFQASRCRLSRYGRRGKLYLRSKRRNPKTSVVGLTPKSSQKGDLFLLPGGEDFGKGAVPWRTLLQCQKSAAAIGVDDWNVQPLLFLDHNRSQNKPARRNCTIYVKGAKKCDNLKARSFLSLLTSRLPVDPQSCASPRWRRPMPTCRMAELISRALIEGALTAACADNPSQDCDLPRD